MSARICCANGESAPVCTGERSSEGWATTGPTGCAQAASVNAAKRTSRIFVLHGLELDSVTKLNRGLVCARRHHHDDLAAFEARLVLDFSDAIELAAHALKQLHSEVGVRHFTTAEAQ